MLPSFRRNERFGFHLFGKATDTFAEIGLDSLDIMELVMQLQEELDCKIELSQDITSIEKLAEYIEKQ